MKQLVFETKGAAGVCVREAHSPKFSEDGSFDDSGVRTDETQEGSAQEALFEKCEE
jgi:hypothetical protein